MIIFEKNSIIFLILAMGHIWKDMAFVRLQLAKSIPVGENNFNSFERITQTYLSSTRYVH